MDTRSLPTSGGFRDLPEEASGQSLVANVDARVNLADVPFPWSPLGVPTDLGLEVSEAASANAALASWDCSPPDCRTGYIDCSICGDEELLLRTTSLVEVPLLDLMGDARLLGLLSRLSLRAAVCRGGPSLMDWEKARELGMGREEALEETRVLLVECLSLSAERSTDRLIPVPYNLALLEAGHRCCC